MVHSGVVSGQISSEAKLMTAHRIVLSHVSLIHIVVMLVLSERSA